MHIRATTRFVMRNKKRISYLKNGEVVLNVVEKKHEAYQDWKAGLKYKAIAEKHEVSLSAVKSWASRDWNRNGCDRTDDKVATKRKERLQPKRSATINTTVKTMAEAVDENDELTENQKEFCVRFMQNRNATQAYLKVYGCAYESAKTAGPRLLANVRVQKELQHLKSIKNMALGGLCGADIVEMHMRIAFSDITDFVEFKSHRVPVTTSGGAIVYLIHPTTGDRIIKTRIETDILLKESSSVDGTLLAEVSQGKDGVKVKIADKMKSLQFLENYFELNPNDRHKKDFDNDRLSLEREKIREAGRISMEGEMKTAAVDDWVSACMGEEVEQGVE